MVPSILKVKRANGPIASIRNYKATRYSVHGPTTVAPNVATVATLLPANLIAKADAYRRVGVRSKLNFIVGELKARYPSSLVAN